MRTNAILFARGLWRYIDVVMMKINYYILYSVWKAVTSMRRYRSDKTRILYYVVMGRNIYKFPDANMM